MLYCVVVFERGITSDVYGFLLSYAHSSSAFNCIRACPCNYNIRYQWIVLTFPNQKLDHLHLLPSSPSRWPRAVSESVLPHWLVGLCGRRHPQQLVLWGSVNSEAPAAPAPCSVTPVELHAADCFSDSSLRLSHWATARPHRSWTQQMRLGSISSASFDLIWPNSFLLVCTYDALLFQGRVSTALMVSGC